MSDAPAARVIDLYHRHANKWDRLRRQDLMERNWMTRFLATLPDTGRDVLDLGCGTGAPLGAYLIQQGCNLTGVDGAAAMIDTARARLPKAKWVTADMRALPSLGKFHGLLAWHSLFHLTPDDQQQMFHVFGRLTHAGAGLMFTSGTSHGEAIGRFEGAPLYHGSLAPQDYRDLLQANGFVLVRYVQNDPNCGGATVWLARKCGTTEARNPASVQAPMEP